MWKRGVYLVMVAWALASTAPSATAQSRTAPDGTERRDRSDQEFAGLPAETARNLSSLRQIARQQRGTPAGEQAQWALAEGLREAGQIERAFKAYSRFIDDYPRSSRFDAAVQAQFEIAKTFLHGRRGFSPTEVFSSPYEKAEKMFSAILEKAPFTRWAPLAQFNLGLAYERQGKLQEAIAAYQTVMDRYPGSDVAASALYQIGYAYMVQGLRGASQDLNALIQARQFFEDYLLFHPQSEMAPQARENLARLLGRESGDLLAIAQFYDRGQNYRSAFIYYNEVLRRDPNSENARLARARIDEMRATFGDDALRTGAEQPQTPERIALRRRAQALVETAELSNYAGPPRELIQPPSPVPTPANPRLRTLQRDLAPLPAVEPDLPVQ